MKKGLDKLFVKETECFGYIVCDNGKIYNKKEKELTQQYKTKQLRIKINNEWKAISISKFIYYAFNRDFDYNDNSLIVGFKDNNSNNLSLDNLEIVYKGNYLQGENNKTSKLTNEQVKEIINKYKYGDKKYTYQQLANRYNVSKSLICKIINGEIRNEKKYKMKNIEHNNKENNNYE